MPFTDPEQRRAWMAEWMRRRRLEFLARHPCPCGAPSTTVMNDTGHGKLTWSWAEERLEAALAVRRLRCDGCAARERREGREGSADERVQRQRASNRAYMQRRRAAAAGRPSEAPLLPQERPERAATVTGRVKAAARPRAGTAPVTVFDDPGWRAERRAARTARRVALGMAAPEPAEDEDDG